MHTTWLTPCFKKTFPIFSDWQASRITIDGSRFPLDVRIYKIWSTLSIVNFTVPPSLLSICKYYSDPESVPWHEKTWMKLLHPFSNTSIVLSSVIRVLQIQREYSISLITFIDLWISWSKLIEIGLSKGLEAQWWISHS